MNTIRQILAASLLSMAAGTASAAVAVDTANFHNEASNSTTTSFTTSSVTVSSGDNMLVACVEAFTNNGSTGFSGVTWGGVALTFYGKATNGAIGLTQEIWYLANPTAGAHTMTASYPANLQGASYLSAVPLSGVNVSSVPSSSFGTLATAVNNTGSPISVTPAGASANGLYLSCAQIQSNTIADINGNMTNLGNVQPFSISTDWIPGVDAGAFSWSGTGGGEGNASAVALAVFGAPAAPAPSNFPFFGVGALLSPKQPSRDPVNYRNMPALAADFRQSGAIGAN
jgi:hypothetical protein